MDVGEAIRTLLQGFEWHTPSEPPAPHECRSSTSHYARLTRLLPTLATLGISDLWLPPGCKANNPRGNGYDCYDMWDLGESDQKWTRSTKWGSREELDDLISIAHEHGVRLIWDAVLSHKTGGDATEQCWAVEVDQRDRRRETSLPKTITAWLQYDFPGRGDTYSALRWRAEHFNGTDWDQASESNAIFKLIDAPDHRSASWSRSALNTTIMTLQKTVNILCPSQVNIEPQMRPGKGWATDVDDMHGNNDYLMFSNVDYKHMAVRQDVLKWAQWMLDEIHVDGFRLDAAMHISRSFLRDLLGNLHGHDVLFIGEVWTSEVERIEKWLDAVGHGAYAFDSPLLMSFSRLGQDVDLGDKQADLRNTTRGSLLASRPNIAVTLVTNHDTQPGQACFMPMSSWIKSLAHAFILLREEGLPCVFWGDLYGTRGPEPEMPACLQYGHHILPDLILARSLFAHGHQEDYFDNPMCIAWTRAGTDEHCGCAVLLSIEAEHVVSSKSLDAGRPGETWIDILGGDDPLSTIIDDDGKGIFSCFGRRAAVFIHAEDSHADRFPVVFDLTAGH